MFKKAKAGMPSTEIKYMKEYLRQLVIGSGSILLTPFTPFTTPGLQITLPPDNATSAIGHDFSRVFKDFSRSIEKVEHAKQLQLEI
jgi:hypothetical protein